MLNESEHIDKLFSDYLQDYEEKVPSYLWVNIQSDLSTIRRRKRISTIRAIAATVALLITFGLGFISSDIVLKKKYEAKWQKQKADEQLVLSETNPSLDSENKMTENLSSRKVVNSVSSVKKDTKNNEKPETNNLLLKLFNTHKNQFLPDSNRKININKIASSEKSRVRKHSNQLLIDTLLLEEGNLPEGGFLLSKKDENYSRWTFGTKFSPVYSLADNNVQPMNDGQLTKSAINNEKPNTQAGEKSMVSFSGGLNVNYRFAKRWSVESGLFYSQRKRMADNLVGSAVNGFEDEMAIYTPDGIKQIESQSFSPAMNNLQVLGYSRDETYYSSNLDYITNYEYLELPLIVRYKIVDNKLGFDVLSGISTDFLIGNKSSITQDDLDLWTGQAQKMSPLLYNATLGFGLNYNFYKGLSFNLEPTFKYSLIQTESTSMLKYPYSFAVFAGFSYRFK
ncbi:MAG: outer membrane beta-barrel protein [Bacteroidales bacterium]